MMSDQGAAGLGIPGLDEVTETGRGRGMTTYTARDATSRRHVVVEVLSVPGADAASSERFEREQRAVASISGHPNILSVFGHGSTADGSPYVVTEEASGGSVATRAAAGERLSGPDIISLGVRLAGALESAHRAPVLHGDITPDDVLLDMYGSPELAHFGLAALAAPAAAAGDGQRLAHVAPELLEGVAPSPASDVYALASTLFRFLAGRDAFVRQGDPIFATVKRIAGDPVPDLRPEGVPDPVCAAVERAMAKDPGSRTRSAEELGRSLQQSQVALGLPMTEMTILGTDRTAVTPPPAPTAGYPVAGPPPGAAPPPGFAPPGGPPPGSYPPPGPVPSAPTRSKAPLVVAAVVAAVAVLGGLAFLLTRGGDESAEDEPERRTTTTEDDEPDDTTTTSTTEATTTTTTEPDETTTTETTGTTLPIGELGDDAVIAAGDLLLLPTGAPYSGTQTELQDDDGILQMSVPEEWIDVGRAPSEIGPTLQAAPELGPFLDGFDTPGAIFTATADRGDDDLEDLLAEIAPGGCIDEGAGNYSDAVYTGLFQVFSACGGGSSGIVTVAARDDDNTETALLLVQLASDADLDALQGVLATFVVIGTLP